MKHAIIEIKDTRDRIRGNPCTSKGKISKLRSGNRKHPEKEVKQTFHGQHEQQETGEWDTSQYRKA